MNSERFEFFANCLPVNGYLNMIIIDTQFNSWFYVPKFMGELIVQLKHSTIQEIETYYEKEGALEAVRMYIDFLIKNKVGFITKLPTEYFPDINFNWSSPYPITNSVIHINEFTSELDFTSYQFENITLIDKYVQIEKVSTFPDFNTNTLYVYVSFLCDWKKKVRAYIQKRPTINAIIVYDSYRNKDIRIKDTLIKFVSDNTKQNVTEFVATMHLICESNNHHSYYNRKLFIGALGEISNTLDNSNHFGFLQDLNSPKDLYAITNSSEFQYYWNVKKEDQVICRDCEFRYMCLDNRLPLRRSEKEWYHSTECNYNPFIGKWAHEEGYRTLIECGVISNAEKFSIDHEKIAQINMELLSE